MIAGTIVMEDTQLHFILMIQKENSVIRMQVTVCDSMTGVVETYLCSPDDFAVALGMAMLPNGELPDFDKTLQAMADKAMPKSANLRWIP